MKLLQQLFFATYVKILKAAYLPKFDNPVRYFCGAQKTLQSAYLLLNVCKFGAEKRPQTAASAQRQRGEESINLTKYDYVILSHRITLYAWMIMNSISLSISLSIDVSPRLRGARCSATIKRKNKDH